MATTQPDLVPRPKLLHFLEQYNTSSQTLAHFLRHTNGRAQAKQTLDGRFDFCTIFINKFPNSNLNIYSLHQNQVTISLGALTRQTLRVILI